MEKRYFLIILFLMSLPAGAMIYDNRYFPWYSRTYSRTCDKMSAFMPDVFIITGQESFKNEDKDKGLYELWGKFDQNALANAFVELGDPNPLIVGGFSDLVGSEILWNLDGKLEGQGISFQYLQQLSSSLSFGASWFFLHLFARTKFVLPEETIIKLNLTGRMAELDQVRRQMLDDLGFAGPKWEEQGFSDVDAYLRYGHIWDYLFKCRRIDAGARFGVLIPSGVKRRPSNASSVPFGGNGFWGIYGALDVEFDLKEDWKLGIWVRANKRFEETKRERIVIANENPLYGAVEGPVLVDPGFTLIFSPYFCVEEVREGLGLKAKYTLVAHWEDIWEDARKDKNPPARFAKTVDHAQWVASYVTLNVFFDFARVKAEYIDAPIISFMWDMPLKLISAHDAAKTHRVSLGIVFGF